MVSMSTKPSSPDLKTALANIPKEFRSRLLREHGAVRRRLRQGEGDAAGLSAARFCETALRLLQHEVQGTYTKFTDKIGNFITECRKLEGAPTTSASESHRVIIPRALAFIYTVRSKRNIGHVGGDIDPDAADTATIGRCVDWVLSELIRIYHGLPLEEAAALIERMSQHEIQDIWHVGGKKRVLRTDLAVKDQVLLLLDADKEAAVLVEDLCSWVEYSNETVFKQQVLEPLHRGRFIEYDVESQSATISPKGSSRVARELPLAGIATGKRSGRPRGKRGRSARK